MDKPPPDNIDLYGLGKKPSRKRHQKCDYDEQAEYERGEYEGTDYGPEGPGGDSAPPDSESTHGGSMFKDVMEFLIPPRDDKPESIRRWRISIGLATVILYGHVLLACGWLQRLGFSGFAYASDVTAIKIELLEQRIFDARVRQCNASTQESRQFYASQVQELLSRFRDTERLYRLPTCDEVR